MKQEAQGGAPINLLKSEKPVDRFYEANVAKIGALGPSLAEKVVYVYNLIDLFRAAMTLLMDDDRNSVQQGYSIQEALDLARDASQEGKPLLVDLRAFAQRRYPWWKPWVSWEWVFRRNVTVDSLALRPR